MTEQELEEYKKANKIETVDVKGDGKVKEVRDNYANFIMIAMMMLVQIGISVLTAVEGDIQNAFPHTRNEWIIWIALRVINAVVAYMIFDSFVKEGIKRGKRSPQYIAANKRFMEIFNDNISNEVKTVSPRVFLAKERGAKAVKLVISASLTGVSIGLATIKTDWTSLLGTIVSLAMMAVWGYLKMLDIEDYFTNEYSIYVAVEEHKLYAQQQKEIMLLKEIGND